MNDMERYLGQYLNKEIWACDFYATRINLQDPYLSLCHDCYVGNKRIGVLDNYSPEKYYRSIAEIINENEMNINSHCRNCEKCKKQIFKYKKLNWITINTSSYCNSSCIYCQGHYASKYDGHEVLSVIKQFHEQNLYDEECLFDWGGGEPTLNPIFDETAQWLSENGYRQRVNTNGIIYSEQVENILKTGLANIRLSLDSGSADCFKKVKGHDGYEQVWENIAKYRQASPKVFLKYNVFNYNSDLSEIDIFLNQCKKVDVHNIIIDSEVKSYQPRRNAGPFYYTKKEFDAMHYLFERANQNGFHVEISDYAFSYRAEYDQNGNLMLPSVFYDNIDRDIISNDIFVTTEPSVSALINSLRNTDKKIIIRGYGKVGRVLYEILCKNKIKISYIVDKSQKGVPGVDELSIDEYLKENASCKVILASAKYWKDFLKEINEFDKKNFEPVYMPEAYYYKYIEMGKL